MHWSQRLVSGAPAVGSAVSSNYLGEMEGIPLQSFQKLQLWLIKLQRLRWLPLWPELPFFQWPLEGTHDTFHVYVVARAEVLK